VIRPEISEHLWRVSTDLLPLRDRFGIEFPDVDYSIAGKDAGQPAPHIGRLDELCSYDVTRATDLEAIARRLAKGNLFERATAMFRL
jgi:hypothetical protein